jgi:tRNA (guanine-N7-)-methyltransferase
VRRGPRLPLEQLAPYLLTLPDTDSLRGRLPLDFRAVFGNDNPVEMEVGFGKGLFLLRAAQEQPRVNFVGVEILRKYQLYTATRMAKRGLGNVRLLATDARALLRDYILSASLQTLHIYFPDPWWKTRHQKRRVFTPEFAQQAVRVLRPGGVLSFASDVEDYARMVVGLVAAHPELRELQAPEPGTPAHDLDYLTNFERKFRKEGRPIYRHRWERLEPRP